MQNQMAEGPSHGDIIKQVRHQLGEIFEESQQSIYVYLDDTNKVCNKLFASLLGYSSPSEWAGVKLNFPEAFVSPNDRSTLVSAYDSAVNKLVGSTISIRWKKKEGGEVATTTMLVPLVVEGHRMALHFVSPS